MGGITIHNKRVKRKVVISTESVVMRSWLRDCNVSEVFLQRGWKKTKVEKDKRKYHTNKSETDVSCHAWPPTVHNEGHSLLRSGSPTVNTVLSHWASFPPLCALPCICPSFFSPLFHIFFSVQFGVKQNLVCRQERAREGGIKIELWEGESGEGSRSAGQLGDQRGAMLVTSPSTHPVYWQGLMHTRAPTVPGHLRSSAGRVGEGGKHRRPQHLFSSQAICSVSPSLNVGLWRTHRHTYTHTQTRRSHTHWGAWSELRQDGWWGTTNTCTHAASTHSCAYTPLNPRQPGTAISRGISKVARGCLKEL